MNVKAALALVFVAAAIAFSQSANDTDGAAATHNVTKIAVIPIHGDIDYGLQKSVDRRVKEALDSGADLIVFDMDTYGGLVDAGVEIGDRINSIKSESDGRVLTVAYISKKAISAGSMISLACQKIVMRTGTTLGDCQAIVVSPGEAAGMKPAPEKMQTFVRATMRKYAQSNGYPEALAVGMVDPDIEVFRVTFPDGKSQYLTEEQINNLPPDERTFAQRKRVKAAGQLLTMSDKEAGELGFSSATVPDFNSAISMFSQPGVPITRYDTNWSEEMVRFLNSPAVSGILLLVGILAGYVAFKTPGFGVPEGIAIFCFALLFLSKYMVGLAGAMEILIFVLGLGLLAVEIFLIPGFGITGIAGIFCIFIALVLAFQKFTIPTSIFEWRVLLFNLLLIFGSFFGATLLFLVIVRYLPKTPLLHKAVLATEQSHAEGYVVASAEQRYLVGKQGVALSILRPAGRAEINGTQMLVIADGDFIEPGSKIVVTEVSGNRVVVAKA